MVKQAFSKIKALIDCHGEIGDDSYQKTLTDL